MPPLHTPGSWLISYGCRGIRHTAFVYFPYAGGSPAGVRPWLSRLPAGVDLHAVHMPGRGKRLGESPSTEWPAVVDHVVSAIASSLAGTPLVLFGHSLGALLSFEVARRLVADRALQLQHLIVSGQRAPHLPDESPPIHALDDAAFLHAVAALDGTPLEVLQHPQLVELLLPSLRADFVLAETYTYQSGERLACPVTVLGGAADAESAGANLEEWRQHTTGPCATRLFPGGHFFLHSSESDIVSLIGDGILARPA